MISSKDFPRVVYREPQLEDTRKKISSIIGIDSEAYTTGQPFILCTSDNRVIDPAQSPWIFLTEEYAETNFVVWNLKYDSGAILYHVPIKDLKILWEHGEVRTKYQGNVFRIQYVPHKLLRFTYRKRTVSFWEISQFYRSSLDKAANTYLGESKGAISTKNFTPNYVKRFRQAIIRYCVRDALLTARLGVYLVDKLEEFGITVSSLYSSASISFKYFSSRSKIVTVWEYWNYDRDALAFASDAYEGGKFEVTTRGAFTGIEYDISSAYPYEIANLIDITNARTKQTREYQPKAAYGFLDCTIENPSGKYIPCGPMVDGVRIYPAGRFRQTITVVEYDYLLSIGVSVDIIDGIWFFVNRKRYPYRRIVKDLFSIKAAMKSKDKMLYNVTKVVLNGFYGKMAQSIEQPDGQVIVGAGWNPVYASYITARTRIRVTQIQNLMQSDCLAVHTDSVIVTKPLPTSVNTDGAIGDFGFVTEGSGILVACGMYQLGEQCAFKGFKAKSGETWRTILERFPNRKTIPYSILHVESWLEAMAKNHPIDRVNVFERSKKAMALNCDKKRIWKKSVRGIDLLSCTEISTPKTYTDDTIK